MDSSRAQRSRKKFFNTVVWGLFLLVLTTPAWAQFQHPGMWANAGELEMIRYRVTNNIEPQKSAFDKLVTEPTCNPNWTPTTVTYVDVGAYNNPKINYDAVVDNSKAVWGQAIMYYVTGDERYAQKAMAILDTHARYFTSIQGHNSKLFAGWVGKNFYKGMEILKESYPGWDPAVEARFNEMYNRVYIPLLRQMNPYGANWEFYMMESLMTAAIFQENETWFNECLQIWSTLFPGYIAPNGECAETCRDLGHAWMGLSGAVRVAEIAWKQGVDLYDDDDYRLLKGLEFHAKYTLSNGGTCTECGQYDGFNIDSFSRVNGTVIMKNMSNANERAMGWETAYNHYHNRLGMEMPLSYQVMMGSRYHGLLRWGDGPVDLFHGEMGLGAVFVDVSQPLMNTWFLPGEAIPIEVDAESALGAIDRVEVYLGNSLLLTDATAPYVLSWTNAPVGEHALRIVALDDAGNEAAVEIPVLVSADQPAPVVQASANLDAVNYGAEKTIDGDLGTRWSAYESATLQYDLRSQRTLSHIGIAFYRGDAVRYDLSVLGSADGVTWTTLWGGLSTGTTQAMEYLPLGDASVRYVRLQCNGNDHDAAIDLSEVEFVDAGGSGSGGENRAPIVNAGPDGVVVLPDASISLTGSAVDLDGSIASYAWSRIRGPACTLAGREGATLQVSAMSEGVYVFRLTATDDAGAVASDDVAVTVYGEFVPGGLVYAIDCGGPGRVGNDGTVYQADQYFTGGDALVKSKQVQGTLDQELFLQYRNGVFSYALPVDNGIYDVTLKTMESYWGGTGQRVFDVSMEGVVVLDDLDLVATTGGNFRAFEYTERVVVEDGQLDLDFSASVNYAIACAILVRRNGDGNPAENLAPTVEAGADRRIVLPQSTVTLAGTVVDPEGALDGVAWTQELGPACTLADADTANLGLSGLASGLYRFRLRATDSAGASASDVVTLTVLPEGSDLSTVVAQFSERGNGSLSGNVLQSVALGGDTTAVEAVAEAGSYFVQWTGGLASRENPIALVGLTGDVQLEARFVTIPDAWFTSHGLTPSGAAARADQDGDGQCAWEEFLFGTDPLDPLDRFAVRVASYPGSGTLEFACPSATGRAYTLQFCNDLPGSDWQDHSTLAGDGGELLFSCPELIEGVSFFRVVADTP